MPVDLLVLDEKQIRAWVFIGWNLLSCLDTAKASAWMQSQTFDIKTQYINEEQSMTTLFP
jgi:hypothetical protein